MRIVRCSHCGEPRDRSNRYTSPANAAKDARDWEEEHESGRCARLPSRSPSVKAAAWAMDYEAFQDHPMEQRSMVAAVQWAARRKLALDHAQALADAGMLAGVVTDAMVERGYLELRASESDGRACVRAILNAAHQARS